jgi:FixJ family two-component response regulator
MILVVEDDDGLRASIARLLHAAGFSSAEFASAEEALADPASEDAACVISDMSCSGKPGRPADRIARAERGIAFDTYYGV